jgi:3',5'-cyclic AMP phosphodiesterase CpdA
MIPGLWCPSGIVVLVAGLIGNSLCITNNSLMALQKNETKKIPSYAGLADIQAAKNHFIIVGDTQSTSRWEFWRERNDRERKLIIDEITRRDPAFVIHLGDLTTRGSSEKHWQEFDETHKEFREKKIHYSPILGNHELYGSDQKALWNYFQRFPHLHQRRWYSFTWNKVAMVMVDSNFSALTKKQIEEQFQWYLHELEKFEKKTEIDFIIVCCHEPPFTNNRVIRPNKEVQVKFAHPFLRFQKARLFFSGHSHSYERFQIKGKLFIVSGGGGGPRHKVIIDPRKQRYQDLFSGPELRFFHFCEIESANNTLLFRVLRFESDDTFTLVDPLVIPKIRR